VKAIALPLQIRQPLFSLHFLMNWWLPFFGTNTLSYSEEASKPSNVRPAPGLLPKWPGMFNSLGQLLGCILHVVAVSITQLPAHPSRCQRCPAASLPNRSQCLWLQGEEREKAANGKKRMSRRCNRNHCFVRNGRAITSTSCTLKEMPRLDMFPMEITIILGER